MSVPSVLEKDPLAVLQEVGLRLDIDEPDHLDLCLLDSLSFKSSSPSKWPSWTDLDIQSSKQGCASHRSEVIKAVYDLCSKLDQMFDRPAYQKTLESKTIDLHRRKIASIRKKLMLFEDVLSPTDPKPLLSSLEEIQKRLEGLNPNTPDVGILDSFVFCSGKPGLFTTWADLDLSSKKTGSSSNRKEVIAALRDLITKGEQMLARPACQRMLGNSDLEKYRTMMISVNEKVALLGDTLTPSNPQPLLSTLEEVNRRFEETGTNDPDLNVLDSFAFRPGKPGLFTVWTDLDLDSHKTGASNNRGAVIMAIDDLLAKFDRVVARPACQKALGPSMSKYCAMRADVREKLDRCKNPIPQKQPTEPKSASVAQVVPPTSSPVIQSSHEQERVEAVKQAIGDQAPVRQPIFLSRDAYIHAGASAGSSMIVILFLSIFFRSLVKAVPLVGLMAVVISLVRRHHRVTLAAKRCATVKELYKTAKTNDDIVKIFPFLKEGAQALFLIRLGSEFRERIGKKYPSLESMCTHIDTFLSSTPESIDRTNALTNIPKTALGDAVLYSLRMR